MERVIVGELEEDERMWRAEVRAVLKEEYGEAAKSGRTAPAMKDVAVKTASVSPAPWPSVVDRGKVRNTVPSAMIVKNE